MKMSVRTTPSRRASRLVVRRNSPVVVTVQGRAQVPPLQLYKLEPLNRLRSQSAPRLCRGATCGRPCSLSGRSEGRRIFTRDTRTQREWKDAARGSKGQIHGSLFLDLLR